MTLQIFINMIKEWVIAQAYATEAWVLAKAYATEAWVIAKAYATEAWVLGKNYTTLAEVKAYTAKCRVHSSVITDIPNGTWKKIVMNVEDFDTNNLFSDNQFTADHGGHYQVNVVLLFETMLANKFVMAAIYKEGAVHSKGRHHTAFGGIVTAVVSDIVELQADEKVEAWAYHNNGNPRSVLADAAYTFMSVGEIV